VQLVEYYVFCMGCGTVLMKTLLSGTHVSGLVELPNVTEEDIILIHKCLDIWYGLSFEN
jgi:hypothetical protein